MVEPYGIGSFGINRRQAMHGRGFALRVLPARSPEASGRRRPQTPAMSSGAIWCGASARSRQWIPWLIATREDPLVKHISTRA